MLKPRIQSLVSGVVLAGQNLKPPVNQRGVAFLCTLRITHEFVGRCGRFQVTRCLCPPCVPHGSNTRTSRACLICSALPAHPSTSTYSNLVLGSSCTQDSLYPRCAESRSARATKVLTGFAAELKGMTDMSHTYIPDVPTTRRSWSTTEIGSKERS